MTVASKASRKEGTASVCSAMLQKYQTHNEGSGNLEGRSIHTAYVTLIWEIGETVFVSKRRSVPHPEVWLSAAGFTYFPWSTVEIL